MCVYNINAILEKAHGSSKCAASKWEADDADEAKNMEQLGSVISILGRDLRLWLGDKVMLHICKDDTSLCLRGWFYPPLLAKPRNSCAGMFACSAANICSVDRGGREENELAEDEAYCAGTRALMDFWQNANLISRNQFYSYINI